MARTLLVKTRPVSGHALSAVGVAGAKVTLAAGDTVNGNSFQLTGQDMLVVYGGSAGGTVTIAGVADEEGRVGPITAYAVNADEIHVFGPFPMGAGWTQADGTVWVNASVATIFLGVLTVAAAA